MSPSIWISALVPLGIGLTFALFRWLCPARTAEEAEPPLTEEERRVFQRWEVALTIPIFISVTALGFAWYFALKGADGLFSHALPGTRFLVRPTPSYWASIACFLGFISSVAPLEWLCRILLRDRYRRFDRYNNERVGFDGWRVFQWLAILIAVGASIAFIAGVTSFTRFDDVGIEVGRPLAFRTEFYKYEQVKTIEHRATIIAPIGTIVPRPHYVIIFDDGISWNTHDGLRDPVPEADDPVIQFVARKSGRSIEEKP